MLIDTCLPVYQHHERHTLRVAAPADRVYAAVRTLDLGGSRVIRLLFRLRGLPASAFRLEGMQRLGFVRLGETPGREVVFGLVGRFWTPGGDLQHVDARGFACFVKPGYARAVWNFSVTAEEDGAARVSTETRIQALDPRSRRRLRCYWFVVGPFSAWIRREALRIIKRAAESTAA